MIMRIKNIHLRRFCLLSFALLSPLFALWYSVLSIRQFYGEVFDGFSEAWNDTTTNT